MSDFKGRHFEGEIVLWAVRWYCRYGVSYRDLQQILGERGVSVDHSTIYRWVQRYAPEIEKRLRWQWRGPHSTSWRVGHQHRQGAGLRRRSAELKKEGKCPQETLHRQIKYLNNIIEADHGKLKQLIRPVRGFKTLKSAYATIKGFEVMRALRKGQASAFNLTRDMRGEARIIETDVCVGGRFRVRFRLIDGTEHESSGEYIEVVRPTRLVMSWRWTDGGEAVETGEESRVVVDLRPIATGTELTFTHERLQTMASRDSHAWGWNGALDKLERHFAGETGHAA